MCKVTWILVAGLALAGAMLAEDNPAQGVWRLQPAGSTANASTLPGVVNGQLRMRKEIFTGGGTALKGQPGTAGQVVKVDVAADGKRMVISTPDEKKKGVFVRE